MRIAVEPLLRPGHADALEQVERADARIAVGDVTV
jgi:hypothetical protein